MRAGYLLVVASLVCALPALAAPPGYRTKTTGRGATEVSSAGYDKLKSLQFFDYLSDEARRNINTFDRLSTGLDMTIEDFFSFVNKLLEEGVPDAEGPVEDDFLTMGQLGQLFGGVNESAVHYILNNLEVSVKELHGAFDTVDVIMVMMFVSSHFEAGGIEASILEIIRSFCYNGRLDAAHFVQNLATSTRQPPKKVARLANQLEGGLNDIKTYVSEVVRPDTCRLLKPIPETSTPLAPQLTVPRGAGGLRGATRASIATSF